MIMLREKTRSILKVMAVGECLALRQEGQSINVNNSWHLRIS